MSTRSIFERMRRNPAADWTIQDVETLCRRYGLLFRPGRGTSHDQIKHPRSMTILTIPAHRPLKPVYIRKLVRYIEEHGDGHAS